ncbi:hypothetical protein F4604DRAFT_1688436 [Suillus subluteus]|nr:hypothetical protein F4604DRAFT_1688436 [Suillus subluteus]
MSSKVQSSWETTRCGKVVLSPDLTLEVPDLEILPKSVLSAAAIAEVLQLKIPPLYTEHSLFTFVYTILPDHGQIQANLQEVHWWHHTVNRVAIAVNHPSGSCTEGDRGLDGSVGDDRLFFGNTCPCVMCSRCMDIPPAGAHVITKDNVTFVCISCHVAGQYHGCTSYLPYFGFYRKGKHIFASFLPIHGALEVSLLSQLSSAPLLMLHLVLVNHDTTSSCFKLASDFLQPYFPSGGFDFRTVVFDIGSGLKIKNYQSKVSAMVQALLDLDWPRIVVAITNNTDNNHGDLFVRYEGKKQYVFARVHSAVIDHQMTATISFNAVHFQPGFAMHLLLAFAELVIIEQLPIHVIFPDMLGQSYKLGCHSDVFLLMPNGSDSLTITQFSWMHSELRPWGQYLLVQCPECGWANAWHSVSMHKDYVFECKNDKCRKGYTFSQPAHSRILFPGKRPDSCWISMALMPTPGIPDDDEDEVADDMLLS